MDIFGIGIPELLFLAILALILLGPEEIAANSRKAGAFLRKVFQSPLWKDVQGTSREIRELPTKLMREAGMEELKNDPLRSVSIDPRNWTAAANPDEEVTPPAEPTSKDHKDE